MKTKKNAGAGAMIVLLIFLTNAIPSNATIVDISVETDKPTYQSGEYVTVSITAYNPNPQPVTLNSGIPFASYVMDDTYNWADWHTSDIPVIIPLTIQSNSSYTWILIHDEQEMQRYPLEVGMHSVVGKVLASELVGNNESLPLQFEVIPEPTTISLFFFSLPIFRVFSKRKKTGPQCLGRY